MLLRIIHLSHFLQMCPSRNKVPEEEKRRASRQVGLYEEHGIMLPLR